MIEKHKRVQLHPATDAWMAGDRYGVIVGIGRKWVHVKCDRSHRVRKVSRALLVEVSG
jgi:hypothetical protein